MSWEVSRYLVSMPDDVNGVAGHQELVRVKDLEGQELAVPPDKVIIAIIK